MSSQEGVEPAAKVMKEEKSADLELDQGSEGAPQPSGVIQSPHTTKRPGWRTWQEGKREPYPGMQQRWEAQWQEFLKTLQAPHSAWEKPQLSETTPWDDAKAFLAAFEQVAEACQWPRKEWAARLLPALSGEAKQAFNLLGDGDKEDYGKVKTSILRGDALKRETQRQHFRQFCCPEVEDPRKMYIQLQKLCCQWLKPERHTKEQILELLVLEQFLASLPVDVQNWIRVGGPDTCSHAVALVEDFLISRRKAKIGKWQGLLEDRVSSLEPEEEPLDTTQEQIYTETKQNGDGEMNLLGSGIRCPSHSSSLLPPEGQEMADSGLTEGQMNIGDSGVSLHMVERTPMQPSQGTMFWKVLQEEDRRVDSLEGLLVPKPDRVSHLAKEEKMFHQFPVESERLAGEDSGLGPRTDQAPPPPLSVKLEEDTCLNFPAPSGHPADFWERPHTTTTTTAGLSQRWWPSSSSKNPVTASQPPSFTEGRDSNQSKKVRAKPWTEFETGTFLDLWLTDYVQEGLQNQFRNEAIYNQISKEMAQRGYDRTSSQCREKINQLKKKFKDVTTHNSRSGVEPRTMPHYDRLATVLLCRKDAAAGHAVGGGTPIPDKRQRVSKTAASVAMSNASIAAHTPSGPLGRVNLMPRTSSPIPSTSAVAHTLPDTPERVAVLPHTSSPVPSTLPTAMTSLPSKRSQYQVIARAMVRHPDVRKLASARPTAPQTKHSKHLRSATRRPASATISTKSSVCLESRSPRTPIDQGDEVEVCLLDPQGETIEAAVYTQVKGGDEEEVLEEIHLELDPAVAEQLMRSLEGAGEPAGEATPVDSSSLPPDSGALYTQIPPQGIQSFEGSSSFEGFRSSSMEEDCAEGSDMVHGRPSSDKMEGLQRTDEPLPRNVEEVSEEEPSPDEEDPLGGEEDGFPAPEGGGGNAEHCADHMTKKKKANRQAAISQRPCRRNSQNKGNDQTALA